RDALILHAVAWTHRIKGGFGMTIGRLAPLQQLAASKECFSINDVRSLIAKQFDVHSEFITSELDFTHDLGADLLDRVELMLAIEEQFDGVKITEDDVEQIRGVGDLIRYLNSNNVKR